MNLNTNENLQVVKIDSYHIVEQNNYRKIVSVQSIILHPMYNAAHNHRRDIAIIKLANAAGLQPAVLPNDESVAGRSLTLTGWGGSFFNGPAHSSLKTVKVQVGLFLHHPPQFIE